MVELSAREGGCQEAHHTSSTHYVPCDAPAARMVVPRGGQVEPYRMCLACAQHNVRNRGANDVGPYTGPPVSDRVMFRPGLNPNFGPGGSVVATADDLSVYETDARQDTGPENILAQITRTVRELRTAREDVAAAESALKAVQDRVRLLEENTLPELMREAKQERLTDEDGWGLQLLEKVRASIPQARMAEAVDWLTNHNQAAIIKRALSLKFGRDEADKAQKALKAILEAGFTPEDKQSIHPQTLEAVVRELMAAGEDVPTQLFGVYVQTGVKLTPPKTR